MTVTHELPLPERTVEIARSCEETARVDVPRYHFDLVDSRTVTDEGGSELPDDIQALDVAEVIARRLLAERPELKGRNFSILVTNQDGEEIGKVPLDVLH
ncbi:DUF6894 family protein [Bradyrhizobium sp. RDM12]